MEVTLVALKENGGVVYKVMKRSPEAQTIETVIFSRRSEALAQFHKWSNAL